MLNTLPDTLKEFSETLSSEPIRHLGTRYNEQGQFLREPGNTVVCHLVKGSLSEAAVLDARRRMMALPESEKLLFTPESSLHMTLFQGIIEYRRRLPYWPEDLPLETPIDDMTAFYLERLKGFQPCEPFKIGVVNATPNGLGVEGLGEADRAAMQAWRDRLADVFGYRHPDHDRYSFHITFAYLMEKFSDEALLAWRRGLDEIVEELRERSPVIELMPPAFCAFEDMKHFEERLVLD
ncbi:DUF1868 domain-containing protein [Rhizobium sp. L1K21]|uniref:DUF1868 domain-containing protein n=1 Tax=Rhizobium sp. L1K21 TaxID=2954933 RepID=UPI0020929DFD|nr:DUF1868 domain-containing protein [Rhizobium sp. L1K21]MCO6185504.1 DUF1868 domain-containing protein [Rhizobium sp. L1K21]